MITEREGFEAMLHTLKIFREFYDSNEITDILSGGQYAPDGESVNSDVYSMWEDAVQKVKNGEPPVSLNLTR